MKYGLPKVAIEKVRGVFALFPQIEKAVLYGSRAKGNFKRGSDIDLTLFGENLDSSQLGEIEEALDDLLLPYTIDLSVYAELNHAKLREHIDRIGVVFYERESARQHKGATVKKGWQKTTLGSVFTTVTGNTPPKNDPKLFGQFMPLVKPPELLNSTVDSAEDGLSEAGSKVARIAPPNSILVSCIGNLGKVGLNTVPVAFNQQINAISPDESRAVPEFMFYQALSCDFKDQLQALSSGTTVPIVNKSRFNSIEIVLPPLAEQQRIVGLLDEAFEGLATAKVNAEKNLQNARTLFESHLQSVFTQRGPGWVDTTIGETCTLRSGNTVSPTLERPIGDIPYLKVADMTFDGNEDQITTSSRFLLDTDVRESAIIPKGATIFPKRGGAILTNKKRIISLPICADLNIMAVIPSAQIDAGLLYFYFLNVDMRKLGTGSAIPQINNYDVSPLRISFPKSLTTQAQIVCKLDDLYEETQRLARLYERKLTALEALKKSLLHQAFTGEL